MLANFYVGAENLNLTPSQLSTLVTWLKSLGRLDYLKPCDRNHWRVRPDNAAIIVEGKFDLTEIDSTAVKNKLAQIFGVAPTSITITTSSTAYGPMATFRYNSQNKLRVIAFGGTSPTWSDSWASVTQYLYDNLAAWETSV